MRNLVANRIDTDIPKKLIEPKDISSLEATFINSLGTMIFILFIFFQMRDLVARRSFLLRKLLDNFLYWVFPHKWVPLYTSVTFTRMRYHHCISNKKWQDEVRKSNQLTIMRTKLKAIYIRLASINSSAALTIDFWNGG